MIAAAVVGAIGVVSVVAWLRRRGTFEREVTKRGWRYQAHGDELATTFTMPPFVHLASFGDGDFMPSRTVSVVDVVTFLVSGSTALSMTVTEVRHSDQQVLGTSTHHVVALHTRQGLPRTIARAGIDVYVLPAYEGLERVRDPELRIPGGRLALLSEDPGIAGTMPFDRLGRELALDRQLTVVTDGDWIYAYRPGAATVWRLDAMMVVVEKLARGIRPTRWPAPDSPAARVYGAPSSDL